MVRHSPFARLIASIICLDLYCLVHSPLVHADELQEIVVTAQRREQNMQDVGVSMTALSGDMLKNLQIQNTQDLAAQVPGLTIMSYSQSVTSFNIRGVSQNDFGDQEEAPIAVYNDDAYNSYLGGVGGSLFDVDRVEVLKGPQGTLFGRNATGGLINVISKRPTDDFEGYLDTEYGSFDRRLVEGAVSGPLNDVLRARLAVRGEKSEGYDVNTQGGHVGGIDNISWRGQLLYTPTAELSVLWNVRGNSDSSTGAAYTAERAIFDPTGKINNGLTSAPSSEAAYAAFCSQEFGFYSGGPGFSDCFGASPSKTPWTVTMDNPGYFRRNQIASTVHVDWLHDDLSLTWITDYNHLRKQYIDDTDASALDLQRYFQDMSSRQVSSELRAHWDEKIFRVTSGFYYLNILGNFDTGFDYAQYGAYFSNPYSQSTRSYAAFTQTEWDIVPTVTVIGGFRYTRTTIDFDFVGTCHDEAATQFFLGCSGFGLPNDSVQSLGYAGDQQDGEYSGKAEVDWRAHDHMLVFGSITRGTKAGGFNASPYAVGLTPDAVPFKPEVLTSYEVGLKSELFDERLRFNASAFFYRYHNYQAFNLEDASPVVFNAQAAAHGAEVELQTAKIDGWEASLGLSALKSTTYDILLPSGDRQDQVMPLAPRATINGVLRKSWQWQSGELYMQGDFSHRSSISLNSINFPVLEDGPHTITNASIGFNTSTRWDFRFFVTNLQNVAERTYCFDGSSFNGTAPCVFAPPRQFGGSVRYSW